MSSSFGLIFEMESSKELTNYSKCEICEKVLISKQAKTIHVSNVHGEGKIFECNVCSRTFESIHGLNYHIKSNHEVYKKNLCVSLVKNPLLNQDN